MVELSLIHGHYCLILFGFITVLLVLVFYIVTDINKGFLLLLLYISYNCILLCIYLVLYIIHLHTKVNCINLSLYLVT